MTWLFLEWLLNRLQWLAHDARLMASKPRHKDWPRKRKEHLVTEPRCRACGTTQNLIVHHKVPYHVRPDLELVDENMATMCEDVTNCHFLLGHMKDWKCWNVHLDEDCLLIRSRMAEARIIHHL